MSDLEEERRPLGQTVVRGLDARGQPFLLLQSTSTPTRSPLVLIGAIDLSSGSRWKLYFYQQQAGALLPYLCRFADLGKLHNALLERDGDSFCLFRLREGIGAGGGTWVRGKASQAVPFLLGTVAGSSPGQPLLVLSETAHDGDPMVKSLAFARGDIEALLPYLWRFIETGRLHDACPEKEYVGVLLRRRVGWGQERNGRITTGAASCPSSHPCRAAASTNGGRMSDGSPWGRRAGATTPARGRRAGNPSRSPPDEAPQRARLIADGVWRLTSRELDDVGKSNA